MVNLINSPGSATGTQPRVKMESAEALFAPDHYVELPVPSPLLLFKCFKPIVDKEYNRDKDGFVEPIHAHQKAEIVYPDGSRFEAFCNGSLEDGLPHIFDVDYLIGALRVASERGWDRESGSLPPDISFSEVIRAARDSGNIAGGKVDACKRAFRRWAAFTIRTAMQLEFTGGVFQPQRANGKKNDPTPILIPERREKETTQWVLSYDVERVERGESSRDFIADLKINPVWMRQTEQAELTAWINPDLLNSLSRALPKAMYLQLVLHRSEGSLPSQVTAPIEAWEHMVGMKTSREPFRVVKSFRTALKQLKAAGIIDDGEVIGNYGKYNVVIAPGQPLRQTTLLERSGGILPIRTRTLLFHLGQFNVAKPEAEKFLQTYGMRVQDVLRRVHYERTVKGGKDREGKPITRWNDWIEKALRNSWEWADPGYYNWVARQEERITRLVTQAQAIAPAVSKEKRRQAAKPSAELPQDIFTPDAWGEALKVVQSQVSEQSFRTWLINTSLVDIDDSTVTISTPSNFAAEWIADKYREVLEAALGGVLQREVQLKVRSQT